MRVNKPKPGREEESQVMLPQGLVKAAVQDAHAGHLKTGKTLGNLKRSYFFRNMYATCVKYIECCQTCQQKDRGRKILAPLGEMPHPWAHGTRSPSMSSDRCHGQERETNMCSSSQTTSPGLCLP